MPAAGVGGVPARRVGQNHRMHRAAHAFGQLLAIIAVVTTAPVVAVRAGARLGGVGNAPGWDDRGFVVALAVLVVAGAFLAWETRRIGRRETAGVVVDRLRVPAPRRYRRPVEVAAEPGAPGAAAVETAALETATVETATVDGGAVDGGAVDEGAVHTRPAG